MTGEEGESCGTEGGGGKRQVWVTEEEGEDRAAESPSLKRPGSLDRFPTRSDAAAPHLARETKRKPTGSEELFSSQ